MTMAGGRGNGHFYSRDGRLGSSSLRWPADGWNRRWQSWHVPVYGGCGTHAPRAGRGRLGVAAHMPRKKGVVAHAPHTRSGPGNGSSPGSSRKSATPIGRANRTHVTRGTGVAAVASVVTWPGSKRDPRHPILSPSRRIAADSSEFRAARVDHLRSRGSLRQRRDMT